MYLSSIPVETGNNPKRPRPGRMWVSNAYRVHQRMCMAFDGKKDERILFRIEGPVRTRRGLRPRILVQSQNQPDWDAAFSNAPFIVVSEDCQAKPYHPEFQIGQRYRFLLRANPSVKKKAEDHPNGVRLGITTQEAQLKWLQRKAELGGFKLVAEPEIRAEGIKFSRRSKQVDPKPHSHLSVMFSGMLEVKDAVPFLATVKKGLGPAKAYGFGLLSLARV